MNEFSHNGITITLGSDATFSAQVGGKFVRKQSLAAMKAHIDKVASEAFKPFDALTYPTWQRKATVSGLCAKVRVIGISKKRGVRFGSLYEFDLGKDGVADKVMAPSKENVDRIIALNKHKTETEKIFQKRRAEESELKEAIVWFKADEMITGEKP